MDGKQMLAQMEHLLEEDTDSGFVDDLLSYQFLNEAAEDFVTRAKLLRTTQAITTVADQSTYDLNADFFDIYATDRDLRYIVQYNNGSSDAFLTLMEYEDVFIAQSDSSTPAQFSIQNKQSLDTQVTGTATSSGALSGGQATLTDSAADFTDVEAGDYVHNTTDASDGVVISKTSTTALVTALFNGTDNDWDSSDAYVIQPQAKMQIVLEPPPDTASHTVTVPYIQRPGPVYSDYGVFKFQQQYVDIVVKYAAWLYKYRDREPNFGDKWYVLYDQKAKLYSSKVRRQQNQQILQVNLRAKRRRGARY